jgi:hypothetical protein
MQSVRLTISVNGMRPILTAIRLRGKVRYVLVVKSKVQAVVLWHFQAF